MSLSLFRSPLVVAITAGIVALPLIHSTVRALQMTRPERVQFELEKWKEERKSDRQTQTLTAAMALPSLV